MWHKRTITLDKDFSVTAKAGNNVFVANRGEVWFEYPGSWIVKPSDPSICFYDVEPPADRCVLEFSIMRLNPGVNWSRLPLEQMLVSAFGGDSGSANPASVLQVRRGDLKIVWFESSFLDPVEKRLALSRCALALRAEVLPLITFSFWPEDKPKSESAWNEVIETLRLAEGPRFQRRN